MSAPNNGSSRVMNGIIQAMMALAAAMLFWIVVAFVFSVNDAAGGPTDLLSKALIAIGVLLVCFWLWLVPGMIFSWRISRKKKVSFKLVYRAYWMIKLGRRDADLIKMSAADIENFVARRRRGIMPR